MEDDPNGPGQTQPPESLLPYDEWTESALRRVMMRALQYAAANGMPGEHHFYITFRTNHPGVVMPARLRAQYPNEITIVLQHQFWDLSVDEQSDTVSVGLSFGGVPSTLTVPLLAVTAFADPYVRYGLRFRAEEPSAETTEDIPEAEAEPGPPSPAPEEPAEAPQVVSLDAFRRRTPPKES